MRDDGAVDFINEGRGARLRVFAALKHRFFKQVGRAARVVAGHKPTGAPSLCPRWCQSHCWLGGSHRKRETL